MDNVTDITQVKRPNKLAQVMRGEYVPNVIQMPKPFGNVGRLWSVYVQGSSLAPLGVTGADIAQILCELGYMKLWYQGKAIEPGTHHNEMPDAELMRGNCTYQAVKQLPSRTEFFKLIPRASERNYSVNS